jgi:hypothetical protein
MVPVIALWQSLSDPQRTAWDQFANEHLFPHWTGSDLRLSGWNWFAKANFRLHLIYEALLSAPPNPVTSIIHSPYAAVPSIEYIEILWVPVSPEPDPLWSILYYVSGPHSAARHPSIRSARYAGYAPESDGIYSIELLQPGYYTVFCMPFSLQGIALTPQIVRSQVA